MKLSRVLVAAIFVAAASAVPVRADLTASLKKGTIELQQPGPMAFGPDSVLFVGDLKTATIYAIGTGDEARGDRNAAFNVENIDARIAEMMGATPKDVKIIDMKVNPATGNAFLSVTRTGSNGMIVKVDRGGKISELPLKEIPFAQLALSNPASGNKRTQAVTAMAFSGDRLFVAGLSNEEFSSTLRSIEFPFHDADKGTAVEIYHGSHGRWETASPVRTFTPFEIDGKPYLLAAYTCTPLVKLPVSELKSGERIKGVTVAELGNMNTPLDMVVYNKDGKTFVLMANTARGVMKVTTDGISSTEPITTPVKGTAGLKYEKIDAAKGVVKLDRLSENQALMLVKASNSISLKSMDLP
jgi:hypothetical protein